jgi:hypothetical protein
MRIGLGQVTQQDCLPIQCGTDFSNEALRLECIMSGFAQSLSCADPLCQPVCPNTAIAPQVSAKATEIGFPPYLTAYNIVPPMPSITNPLMPVRIGMGAVDTSATAGATVNNSPGLWCDLNTAIANSPIFASAILLAAFLFLKGMKK